MTVHGFAPISDRSATILVLGTMPGKASLRAGEYYGHPRNAFWRLLGELLGFDPTLPYRERTACLTRANVAVWDVLQLCTRATSLDSDIVDPVANDFAAFFDHHPRIARVYFNGAAAETLFRRHVLDQLDGMRTLDYVRLPSTSPANASVSAAAKRAAWQVLASPRPPRG